MRLLFSALALVLGCGPAARATPTHAVDPGTLYVAQVHWTPSEISVLGVVPAFPRASWVALVASDGWVRHARVGGPSRRECDDCIGPRMVVVASLEQPVSRPYAIGPSDQRLPRVTLLSETPFAGAGIDDGWISTSTFDLDEDGTADLEGVERCGAMVPTGCDERVCSRRCAATRTVGQSDVRGELCRSLAVVTARCVPPPVVPEPEVVIAPGVSPEPVVTPEPEAAPEPEVAPVTEPSEPGTARRRHWGSRRRPR